MTTLESAVEVTAHRSGRGWELHVADEHDEHDGDGNEEHDEHDAFLVLRARRLSGVEHRVRQLVAAVDGVDPTSVHVRVSVRFGSWLDGEIAAVRAELELAERSRRQVAARSRRLAAQLREAGLSGADIAVVLHVSPQRVSQLVKGPED